MVANPRLLLLDEPLSALDAKLRKNLQAELRSLHRKLGVTFIHVTHDLEEAMVLADRICVMRNGRIVQQGPPSDIYYRPVDSFIASFIGDTNLIPIAFAETANEGRVFRSPVELRGTLSLAADQIAPGLDTSPGAEALLMVRPEHLRPSAGASEPEAALSLEVEVTEIFVKGSVIQYQAVARGTDVAIVFELQGDRAPRAQPGDGLALTFDTRDAFVLEGSL